MRPQKDFSQSRKASHGSERSINLKRDTVRTWALVINGARCRILRELSIRAEDAPAEPVLRSESRNLRDIMSDKPGRSYSSTGGDGIRQRPPCREAGGLRQARHAGASAPIDAEISARKGDPAGAEELSAPPGARACGSLCARGAGWNRPFLTDGRRRARWRLGFSI
jgi:hypothetical protein